MAKKNSKKTKKKEEKTSNSYNEDSSPGNTYKVSEKNIGSEQENKQVEEEKVSEEKTNSDEGEENLKKEKFDDLDFPWLSGLNKNTNILQAESPEIPGIMKDSYHEESSFETREERDRLRELLEQTDNSQNDSQKSPIENESLEDMAFSSTSFSMQPNESRQSSYENFSNAYSNPGMYQSTGYHAKSYEEIKQGEESSLNSQDPKVASPNNDQSFDNAYIPKPVERFEEGVRTGFAMGADSEKESAREKYKLR